jgi:hypothetical protein
MSTSDLQHGTRVSEKGEKAMARLTVSETSDLGGVVIRDLGRPSCGVSTTTPYQTRLTRSYTVRTVDQDHGHGGQKVFWLDRHSLFFEVIQKTIISRMEDRSSHSGDIGENVTSASCVFTTLIISTA